MRPLRYLNGRKLSPVPAEARHRKPIYINSEAIRILTFPAYPPKKKQLETLLAEKVRSVLLHGKRLSEPEFSTEFISGKRRYLCRAIGLQPNTALLLERKLPDNLMFPKWPSDTS